MWSFAARGQRVIRDSDEGSWQAFEIDTLALKQDLDEQGPFQLNDQGCLEAEHMIKFKVITARYSFQAFLRCREKMLPVRVNLL